MIEYELKHRPLKSNIDKKYNTIAYNILNYLFNH